MASDWVLTGGQVISDGLVSEDCLLAGGCFADSVNGARRFDAQGLVLAPGIIDLHGDGFERNFSPRNGVFFDIETALLETDRQLIANGITTAYLALTVSWEPGLRSVDNAKQLIEALQRLRPRLLADIRVQLRWEVFALDAADQIEAWLALDPKPTLAFNDHFTGLLRGGREQGKIADYAARAGLDPKDYRSLIDRVAAREGEVEGTVRRLAAKAQELGVVCFAHDESSPDTRRRHRGMGIVVSEFPLTRSTAKEACAEGEATILGAPNVLRGGSHIGALDAEPAVREGLCSVLASDYYYPAPLRAVSRIAAGAPQALADVWPLVSANAARAAELDTKGRIASGASADLVALHFGEAGPSVVAAFRKGELVFLTDQSRI